jgi:SnoaL-like domain
MEATMTEPVTLPEPIATYFITDKRNVEAIGGCFTEDAVVKDEGHTYTGVAAIKQWKVESATKYNYTSVPLALERRDGMVIVTSRLTGNFPGSPVDLRFFFRLERGKIASLEIIL